MTIAADHRCFRRSWDWSSVAERAATIVRMAFELKGLPIPCRGDAGELWEEAVRAIFLRHLILDDGWKVEQASHTLGMKRLAALSWMARMAAGPRIHRAKDWDDEARAVLAVIEARLPHGAAHLEAAEAWDRTAVLQKVLEESMLDPAAEQELIQAFFDRQHIRLRLREVLALLSDRHGHPITAFDILTPNMRELVTSGNYVTGDLFWLDTRQGTSIPSLIFVGGNPTRLLHLMIGFETSARIEEGIRYVVETYGVFRLFAHDNHRSYRAQGVSRTCAGLGSVNLSTLGPSDARVEAFITHVRDPLPLSPFLDWEEVAGHLAVLLHTMAPRREELPFRNPTPGELKHLGLSEIRIRHARGGTVPYKRRRIPVAGVADGTPVQVALGPAGLVAIYEDYGVVRGADGVCRKASGSRGYELLGSTPCSELARRPRPRNVREEEARLTAELEALPERRSPGPPLITGTGKGDGRSPIGGGRSGGCGGLGGGPTEDWNLETGTEPTGEGSSLGPHLEVMPVDAVNTGVRIVPGDGGVEAVPHVIDTPEALGPTTLALATSRGRVVRLNSPEGQAAVLAAGHDPEAFQLMAKFGHWLHLKPFAKGHPAEMDLADAVDKSVEHRENILLLINHGTNGYASVEAIICDGRIFHSGLEAERVAVSPDLVPKLQELNTRLLKALELIDDRTACLTVLARVSPELDDLVDALAGTRLGQRLLNVRFAVCSALRLVPGKSSTPAKGALIRALYLMPVRPRS